MQPRPLQPNPEDESTMLVPIAGGTFVVVHKDYADAVGKYNWYLYGGCPYNNTVGYLSHFIPSLEDPILRRRYTKLPEPQTQ